MIISEQKQKGRRTSNENYILRRNEGIYGDIAILDTLYQRNSKYNNHAFKKKVTRNKNIFPHLKWLLGNTGLML